jgi:hypothetical protein
MKKITLTEEIRDIKRLYNFKKGDTMLLEETCKKDDPKNIPLCSDIIEDIENKTIRGPFTEKKFYTVTLDNGCPKKCLKEKTELSKDTNAGELQKYLIEKGYLPEFRYEKGKKVPNIDWDFGDESAKSFGDFIEDKIGVDVGIETLNDLQDYLTVLGFSTGARGFGDKIYKALKFIINLIEVGAATLTHHPRINNLAWFILSVNLTKARGKQVTSKDKVEFKEDVIGNFDMMSTYDSYLGNIVVDKITYNKVYFSGDFSGNMKIAIGDPEIEGDTIDGWYNDNGNLICEFTGIFNYKFKIKDGKFCLTPTISDVNINSVNSNPLDWTNYKISVKDNNIMLKGDLIFGFKNKNRIIKTIPVKEQIGNKVCESYCVTIDNIIKLINGKLKAKEMGKLITDDCPKPKAAAKTTFKSKKRWGTNPNSTFPRGREDTAPLNYKSKPLKTKGMNGGNINRERE